MIDDTAERTTQQPSGEFSLTPPDTRSEPDRWNGDDTARTTPPTLVTVPQKKRNVLERDATLASIGRVKDLVNARATHERHATATVLSQLEQQRAVQSANTKRALATLEENAEALAATLDTVSVNVELLAKAFEVLRERCWDLEHPWRARWRRLRAWFAETFSFVATLDPLDPNDAHRS